MKNILLAMVILTAACNEGGNNSNNSFGEVNGKKVLLFALTNSKGDTLKITNYGGTVTSWIAADKQGNKSNIVLGFDSLKGYLEKPPYFGALIGRYGNRIAKGKFTLDSNTYTLATNNGVNHLHGGNTGFDKVVWDVTEHTPNSLSLSYLSKDGEEGYPGNLQVKVKYSFSDEGLKIEYNATTDKPTVINLTNHSYFNLSGNPSNNILNHQLTILADHYTPVDTTLIPTGEIKAVEGTPFDFRTPHAIGERIDSVPGGYDHNFVLNKKGDQVEKVAELSEATSGRRLEVWTTEPGIQFYSGNFLDGTIHNSQGIALQKHTGMCLETQHFPNSPNQPNFPSVVLRPGQTYHTVTEYKLLVQK